MVEIREVTNQQEWDNVAKSVTPTSVLQSWHWGDFQESLGRKVWKLGIYDNDILTGVALTQKIPTRLRTHLYVSNGPAILRQDMLKYFPSFIDYLKKLGTEENVEFIRMDPVYEDSQELYNELKSLKLVRAKTFTQSENKWLLDVTQDEESILANMEKSTRYEIRRSAKEGVVVYSSTDLKDYDKFEKLFLETAKRQNFITHPLEYYKKQFEILTKYDMYKIFWAEKDGHILAAALISFFGDSASYLHAASESNREVNKLFAPPAVVWAAIREAKLRGMKYFDFWGIALTDDPKHPWAGFTRFKKGFGGFLYRIVRAHDIPLSPKYPLIALLDATRDHWGLAYSKLLKVLKK